MMRNAANFVLFVKRNTNVKVQFEDIGRIYRRSQVMVMHTMVHG